ncbi:MULTISPECIES: BREX system Lon protease-like protein BrxL [Fusobacterium]|uniref:Uncharacterized protein n=1 Tax=Fusobacterium nucleatum TaxID=851 RepID=A0A323TY56_FUSNU|nr:MULTISPECIES: BREX system Lon protease-like protein BrxL [Fusobacterium]PCR86179.1 hypothetical protein CQA79_00230 [Fusobacterium nucleatum]PZA05511.1 hypothetical protein DNF10_01315 [Fusobacterium nucleatum]QJX50241.1 hypothetical protein HOO60_04930 [Fusobacterium nucleatum]HCE33113.1 hypothetical protein [Fusobacterium sp.]
MAKVKNSNLGLIGKDIKERIDGVLAPINIDSSNNLYYKLISLFKLLPLASENLYGLSLGNAGMGKSKVYELLDSDIVLGIPTAASLRGNANSNESEALFEKSFLLFEEIAEGTVQTEALGLLKATSTSKKFLRSNETESNYNGSYVMNFNYYGNETSLESIKKEEFKKVLPTIVQDEAFLSRMSFVLIHNNGTVGNPIYKNDSCITPSELKEYLFSLREIEFDLQRLEINIFEKMETFSSREKENIEKLLRTILLIFYPEAREDKTFCISNYIVEGFLDIAIHFHSFIKDEYRSYLTKNSVKLITELLDYPVSEEGTLEILPNDRILVEDKEKIFVLATNEYGRKQNEKEFLLFKKGCILGLEPIESRNNYHKLSYIKKSDYVLSNKFKIDEDKIELETYRAREKQREVLDMLKENICYYIGRVLRVNELFISNGQCFFQPYFNINYEFLRSLIKVPCAFSSNNENLIAYFKRCIEYICDIEKAHNHVLEVKKFLTSFPNLFDIRELEFLDSYSVTLDIEISKGIICKEIDQINKEKIRKSIGFDTNLEDEYYLYYVEEETLSPRIFIL